MTNTWTLNPTKLDLLFSLDYDTLLLRRQDGLWRRF